jgi:hypothetical protein
MIPGIIFSQDSAKFHGGSFDGFTYSQLLQSSLGGGNIDISKYHGGSYDGYALFIISQTGLGGQQIDAGKFFGGSYDGFSLITIGQTGLGGQTISSSKYFGGSYDGFALFSLPQSGLSGQTINLSKFSGGSYDGFTLNFIAQTGLGGQVIDVSKYKGGSFDGYAIVNNIQSSLGGQVIDLAKYKGGSFDGFTVTGTALIPLSGNRISLKLTALIEGFYNPGQNNMVRDTVMVYVRTTSSPFTKMDSAKVVPDSLGMVTLQFQKSIPTGNYYIVISHRNSIETWSKSPGTLLAQGTLNIYDFSISQSQAYGNNLVLKGTRYCIYSGDVNRDEVIDGADLSLIDNDASNFMKGYIATDVNGDNLADGSDLAITDNNASAFVQVMKPPGASDIIIIKGVNNNKYQKLNGK